jgi:transcriptional regulator with XRE-family HTH domain
MSDVAVRPRIGDLLREWRSRRRLTQMDLALEAGVSPRHLSFIETGRARPSSEMVLRLAEHLDVPLRERNTLLLAAGFAPAYAQRGIDEPEMGPVRETLERILAGHEPYPAIVVDRHWGLVAANRAAALFLEGVAPQLLEPPVNVMRLSLHPDGLARRIVNLAEWRAHVLDGLGRQAVLSGDPAIAALHDEMAAMPGGDDHAAAPDLDLGGISIPLVLRDDEGGRELRFISTATTFTTAVDVTVSELSIESFFPADEATAAVLRERAG